VLGIRQYCATIALVALTLGAANPAVAQEEEQAAVKPNLAAEEIVVTARKRAESLQDIPLSVTAFSAETLERAGAFDNEDVALLTPNFSTNRQVGRRLDRPTIRGMAAPSTGSAPNASYFIDGVFVSGSIQTMTLGPVERVEILRGPQSAQFGRATFSGAVNYVTKKPTNEFSGQAKASYASHDSATISSWASGPIVRDKLYAFGSASYDTYGGEYRNSLKEGQAPIHSVGALNAPQRGDNSDLGGTETKDIALKLLWTPSDTSEVTFKASYSEGDDDHYAQVLQELGELNCYLPTNGSAATGNPGATADNSGERWYNISPGSYCGTMDPDKVSYDALSPFNPNNPAFNISNSGTEIYTPGFLFPPVPGVTPGIAYTLPANGDARQARFNLPDLIDGIAGAGCNGDPRTIGPNCAAPTEPGTRRDLMRFLLQYEQDFSDWTWLSRVAYNKDEMDQSYDLDRTELRPIFGNGLFTMQQLAELEDYTFETRLQSPDDKRLRGIVGFNYFRQDRTSQQRQFTGFESGQMQEPGLQQETTNVAWFGTLEYDINDQWTISGEARLAREERDIDDGKGVCTLDDVNSPDQLPFVGQKNVGDSAVRSFTPRFTVRYQPTDNTSIYALAAYGEKPAEFVMAYYRVSANPCQTLVENSKDDGLNRIEPEEAWTYEWGTKTNWMDRRLITNFSMFYIDWENQAVAQNTLVGSTLTQINVNSGTSEVFGVELETTFVFTENLTGQFSYGLADAKFKQYNDENLANLTGVGIELEFDTDPFKPNQWVPVIGADGGWVYDQSANNADGKRVPGSAKHSFIFGLNYSNEVTLNLFNGAETLDWFARTDFVLETDRYSQANNFTQYPSRKMWNGRIGLDSANWTLTGYVNNILDDLTPTGIFNFPLITGALWSSTGGPTQNSVSPAFGRAYGLELIYRFGD